MPSRNQAAGQLPGHLGRAGLVTFVQHVEHHMVGAGGTMLTMPGWASAPRRYDIDAPAGVSAISVTSR